jgi:hypothetical protein
MATARYVEQVRPEHHTDIASADSWRYPQARHTIRLSWSSVRGSDPSGQVENLDASQKQHCELAVNMGVKPIGSTMDSGASHHAINQNWYPCRDLRSVRAA